MKHYAPSYVDQLQGIHPGFVVNTKMLFTSMKTQGSLRVKLIEGKNKYRPASFIPPQP